LDSYFGGDGNSSESGTVDSNSRAYAIAISVIFYKGACAGKYRSPVILVLVDEASAGYPYSEA